MNISGTDVKDNILKLLSPSWYKHQLSGWSKLSYTWLAIGIAFITYTSLGQLHTGIGIATWLAAVLGFTCVLAITNARPLNGLLGLVSALIYIVVAFEAHNPSDALVQFIFIILLDIPVILIPSWSENVESKVRKISEVDERGENHSSKFWYATMALAGVVALIVAYFIETSVLHTPRPFWDSFTLATGFVGALLTTYRFSESYYFWIIQGLSQIILWGLTAKSGDASAVLFFTYILYMGNDVIALFDKGTPWFHHNRD